MAQKFINLLLLILKWVLTTTKMTNKVLRNNKEYLSYSSSKNILKFLLHNFCNGNFETKLYTLYEKEIDWWSYRAFICHTATFQCVKNHNKTQLCCQKLLLRLGYTCAYFKIHRVFFLRFLLYSNGQILIAIFYSTVSKDEHGPIT